MSGQTRLLLDKNVVRRYFEGAVDADVLEEVIHRVVEVAQPHKIILFGSAARDAMGPHSDLDLLVVVQPGLHRRRLAQAIYRHLVGVGFPVDVVVVTQEDVERYRYASCLFIEPALLAGRWLHEREPVPAG